MLKFKKEKKKAYWKDWISITIFGYLEQNN